MFNELTFAIKLKGAAHLTDHYCYIGFLNATIPYLSAPSKIWWIIVHLLYTVHLHSKHTKHTPYHQHMITCCGLKHLQDKFTPLPYFPWSLYYFISNPFFSQQSRTCVLQRGCSMAKFKERSGQWAAAQQPLSTAALHMLHLLPKHMRLWTWHHSHMDSADLFVSASPEDSEYVCISRVHFFSLVRCCWSECVTECAQAQHVRAPVCTCMFLSRCVTPECVLMCTW